MRRERAAAADRDLALMDSTQVRRRGRDRTGRWSVARVERVGMEHLHRGGDGARAPQGVPRVPVSSALRHSAATFAHAPPQRLPVPPEVLLVFHSVQHRRGICLLVLALFIREFAPRRALSPADKSHPVPRTDRRRRDPRRARARVGGTSMGASMGSLDPPHF